MAEDYTLYGNPEAIARRRALAEAMMNGALNPVMPERMGNMASVGSPLSALASGLEGYLSAKMSSKADADEKAMKTAYKTAMDDYANKGFAAMQGTPEQRIPAVVGSRPANDPTAMLYGQQQQPTVGIMAPGANAPAGAGVLQSSAGRPQPTDYASQLLGGLKDTQISPERTIPEVKPNIIEAARQFSMNPQTQAMALELLKDQARGSSQFGLNPVFGKDASGRIVPMQLGTTGKMVQSQLPEGVSEVVFPNEYKDIGGQVVSLSRYGVPTPVRAAVKTPSPDVVVSQEGQNKRQEKEPVIAGMKARAEGQAAIDVAQDKKQQSAGNILGLLDQAEPLIDQSTGSVAGNVADKLAGAAGYSTSGAQNIARLRTIQGALLGAMPRMEGPQSNYDVQMYKESAGQIADPNVPAKTRKAALGTLRALQQKYAGDAQKQQSIPQPPKPAAGGAGWGIKRLP